MHRVARGETPLVFPSPFSPSRWQRHLFLPNAPTQVSSTGKEGRGGGDYLEGKEGRRGGELVPTGKVSRKAKKTRVNELLSLFFR